MLLSSPLKFNESEIRTFSEKYVMALELEYLFHNSLFAGKTYEQRQNTAKNRIFTEQDLLEKYPNPKVLDVGSGLVSIVGTLTQNNQHKISLRACDALGVQYSILTSLYNVTPYVKTEFAFVERLTDRYERGSFDIVRMCNALDHCYDPFIGIFEMLKVVRTGGIVRLIHSENESERELGYGLHQWNITNRANDSMVIWRKGFSMDIKDILSNFVEISTVRVKQGNRTFIHTDITKLEDIETTAKSGMNILDETMIIFCLMKTSRYFASAYKKVNKRDPFRKGIIDSIAGMTPARMIKYVPNWLKTYAKHFLGEK